VRRAGFEQHPIPARWFRPIVSIEPEPLACVSRRRVLGPTGETGAIRGSTAAGD